MASGNASDFAASNPADKLIDLQSEMKSDYRRQAIWLMNRRTSAKVRKFKGGQGLYIWERALAAGQPDMLLGHPVVVAEDFPDVGTDTYPVAFTNLRVGYTIISMACGFCKIRIPTNPTCVSTPTIALEAMCRTSRQLKLLKIATS